jgi:hypothetical protein
MKVESEASTTSGYTPFLCFDVENIGISKFIFFTPR